MEIFSYSPKGFCDGVYAAFSLAEKALKENPGRILYLIGSLVHNERAMEDLLCKGAVLISEKDGDLITQMASLPDGSLVLYSAHGHDEEEYAKIAKKKRFIVYDASCKHIVSNLEKMKEAKGRVAFISDPKHLESYAGKNIDNVDIIDPKKPKIRFYDYVISQTSLDEETFEKIKSQLQKINPEIVSLDGRCPSTKLRQENAKKATDADLFVIVGSKDSANTKRLASIAKEYHPQSDVLQVLDVNELKKFDLKKYKKAAILSGASSPAAAYEAIEDYLASL